MKSRLALFSSGFAIAFASGVARADDDFDVRAIPHRELIPHSLVLSDSRSVVTSFEAAGGPIWFRGLHDRDFSPGLFELRVGKIYTTEKYPFFVEGFRYVDIRVFDSKSYQVSIQQEIAGSLALGALEPEVRIGVHLFEADVIDGSYNIGLLSPRVMAGVGIRANKFRLDIGVYSEYLWRWFGSNYLVRGLVIGIAADTKSPRLRSFAEGPEADRTP